MKIKPASIVPLYITAAVLALAVWGHVVSRRNAEVHSENPGVEAVEWLNSTFPVRLGAKLNDTHSVARNIATAFI